MTNLYSPKMEPFILFNWAPESYNCYKCKFVLFTILEKFYFPLYSELFKIIYKEEPIVRA